MLRLLSERARCAQEIVTNALRHSQARHLWLSVASGPEGVAVRGRDDGIGAAGIGHPHLGSVGSQEKSQVQAFTPEADDHVVVKQLLAALGLDEELPQLPSDRVDRVLLRPVAGSLILAVLRIVTAYLFILHGTAKLFHVPHVAAFDNLQLFSLVGLAGVLYGLLGTLRRQARFTTVLMVTSHASVILALRALVAAPINFAASTEPPVLPEKLFSEVLADTSVLPTVSSITCA